MQHAPAPTVAADPTPVPTSISGRKMMTTLYYLVVLLGLVVLYGRGDFSSSGFIYQAF